MTPPKRNSDCLIKPVLKAMAFGGVETGKNNAQEALSPMTKGKIIGFVFPPPTIASRDTPIGMRMVVAAVLLIKFDNNTVIKPNKISNNTKLT